jgi:N-acetylglucosamine kinase-like BadF-type ATPase
MTSEPPQRVLAIGVDVGGTWVRAIVVRDGRVLNRVRAPVRRVPELSSFLLTLARAAHRGKPARGRSYVRVAVVAARGVWTGRERAALRRRLAGVADRVEVVSDAEAALLGALENATGVLILSGTGSIVLGRDARGRLARAGGLGPLLGDEGSAFWLGREWLRHRAREGASLAVRRLARAPDAHRRIAALARDVLARAQDGQARAREIVRDGQRHLADFAVRVARELRLPAPLTVSWAGSVMENARFRAGVARALSVTGFRARWVAPAASPVHAVARLAWQLAAPREAARRGRTGRRTLRRPATRVQQTRRHSR